MIHIAKLKFFRKIKFRLNKVRSLNWPATGTATIKIVHFDIENGKQIKNDFPVFEIKEFKDIEDGEEFEIDLLNFNFEPSIEDPSSRTVRYGLVLECLLKGDKYPYRSKYIPITISEEVDLDWLDA